MEVGYFEKGKVFGGFVAFITFVVPWIYCIATYGFLFGVGLGWLPSIIVAVIAYPIALLLRGPIKVLLLVALMYAVFALLKGR